MKGKERRSTHQTQWAAQFAVASELCKRGYQVALTLGNHPMVDLMVVSQKGTPFSVDVKGQAEPYQAKNPWPVRSQKERDGLFYVLAYVPKAEPNRFFVLTQSEVNQELKQKMGEYAQRNPGKVDKMPCVSGKCAIRHENRWDKLPA